MAVGLLGLLDDVALLADDLATATKMATTKTAGILGDDVAVSAEKATGFKQERELKIIWEIIKGSLLNKLIILPVMFLLSYFLPSIIPVILVIGAFYLVFEGVEKIEEYIHNMVSKTKNEKHIAELKQSTSEDILEIEKSKIKSAIFTDFVLSVEIVVIALNSVIKEPLMVKLGAVSAVALIATFGVYGLVALLVRIDNLGFWFIGKEKVSVGEFLIAALPKIIKVIGVIGTLAMLLVGGEIILHNIDFVHHMFKDTLINSLIVGIIAGICALIVFKLSMMIKTKFVK